MASALCAPALTLRVHCVQGAPTWLHPPTHPHTHTHTSLTLTVSSSLPLMSSAPLLLAARQLTAALCSSRWLASTPRGRQDGLLPAPAGPAPLEPGPPSSPADPARCWPMPVVMAALTASYTEPDGSPATCGATRTHTHTHNRHNRGQRARSSSHSSRCSVAGARPASPFGGALCAAHAPPCTQPPHARPPFLPACCPTHLVLLAPRPLRVLPCW